MRDIDKFMRTVLGTSTAEPEGAASCQAVVARVLEVTSEGMRFTMPEWDGGSNAFGPSPWPNNGSPSAGDQCLVIFPTAPDDAEPWVIGWWPSGG